MSDSFYWHDYETWGADSKRDRAAQFAGQRTDGDLNPVGPPLVLYCRPADDMLPQPEACLITGITPQKALAEGLNEAEFFAAIHDELSQPGTCGVGYNSIRFDDEFTRYGLYRNLFDPYGREWKNGNSRWDLIDVVRLTHALRPEGIEWPEREPGITSFKLEELTAANGIFHEAAHDALSDVHATIALARLIRQHQPRLFEFALGLRDKRRAGELCNLRRPDPILHVSSMYPASRGCIAQVLPVARDPVNKNGVVVFDLSQDPSLLVDLDFEEIGRRVFTSSAELEQQGLDRIGLKTVHLNKSPMLSPMTTLTPYAAERWQIDPELGRQRAASLRSIPGLEKKIQQALSGREFPPSSDPDQNLYGGFIGDDDRRHLDRLRQLEPAELARASAVFDDHRLHELLFRYRARNWPESLRTDERNRWQEYRLQRLTQPDGGGSIALAEYRRQLARLMVDPALDEDKRQVLSELADWPQQLGV